MQDFENTFTYSPSEAAHILRDTAEAYYFILCGAEKINTLTAAHKHHLSKAIDRANDIGKVVDDLTKILKDEI